MLKEIEYCEAIGKTVTGIGTLNSSSIAIVFSDCFTVITGVTDYDDYPEISQGKLRLYDHYESRIKKLGIMTQEEIDYQKNLKEREINLKKEAKDRIQYLKLKERFENGSA